MATTEPVMGLTLPALNSDPGTWDTSINLSLERIPAHTHESGYGVRIKPGGLNIDSDLTFAGNAATNLKAVNFFAQASYTTNKSLWVSSANDDLYYRRAGTDHRLTVNGVLNLSLVGGITGDYAAAGAALYYDDTAKAYRFLRTAPLPNFWAGVQAGGVDLYEAASGISNTVRLRSPAALAASYTLTLPGALPGSTVLAQVSSAGDVTFSNTVTNAVTMSSSLSVGTTLGVTGAATLSSTLGVTGLITATGGLTAAANQNVTVSGTGEFKHGDKVRQVTPTTVFVAAGDTAWTVDIYYIESAGTDVGYIPVMVEAGERIKSLTVALYGNGVADITIAAATISKTQVFTSLGSLLVSNQAASWSDSTVNLTDTTIVEGDVLYATVVQNAPGLRVGNIRVTYDRP